MKQDATSGGSTSGLTFLFRSVSMASLCVVRWLSRGVLTVDTALGILGC